MTQNITALFYSPQKHKNALLMTVRCQKAACCSFRVWCIIVMTVKSHFHLQEDQHLTEWDWTRNVISECVYHIKAWVYKFQSREKQLAQSGALSAADWWPDLLDGWSFSIQLSAFLSVSEQHHAALQSNSTALFKDSTIISLKSHELNSTPVLSQA